jgi:hypothetical protein
MVFQYQVITKSLLWSFGDILKAQRTKEVGNLAIIELILLKCCDNFTGIGRARNNSCEKEENLK